MLNINDQKLIVVFIVCSFVFVLLGVVVVIIFFSLFKESIDVILFEFQVDPCMNVSFYI